MGHEASSHGWAGAFSPLAMAARPRRGTPSGGTAGATAPGGIGAAVLRSIELRSLFHCSSSPRQSPSARLAPVQATPLLRRRSGPTMMPGGVPGLPPGAARPSLTPQQQAALLQQQQAQFAAMMQNPAFRAQLLQQQVRARPAGARAARKVWSPLARCRCRPAALCLLLRIAAAAPVSRSNWRWPPLRAVAPLPPSPQPLPPSLRRLLPQLQLRRQPCRRCRPSPPGSRGQAKSAKWMGGWQSAATCSSQTRSYSRRWGLGGL